MCCVIAKVSSEQPALDTCVESHGMFATRQIKLLLLFVFLFKTFESYSQEQCFWAFSTLHHGLRDFLHFRANRFTTRVELKGSDLTASHCMLLHRGGSTMHSYYFLRSTMLVRSKLPTYLFLQPRLFMHSLRQQAQLLLFIYAQTCEPNHTYCTGIPFSKHKNMWAQSVLCKVSSKLPTWAVGRISGAFNAWLRLELIYSTIPLTQLTQQATK